MNEMDLLWDAFRTKVIPKDAGPTQLQGMKLAYFAGVWDLLKVCKMIGDSPSNPTQVDIDAQRMESIDEHVRGVLEQLIAELAE